MKQYKKVIKLSTGKWAVESTTGRYYKHSLCDTQEEATEVYLIQRVEDLHSAMESIQGIAKEISREILRNRRYEYRKAMHYRRCISINRK